MKHKGKDKMTQLAEKEFMYAPGIQQHVKYVLSGKIFGVSSLSLFVDVTRVTPHGQEERENLGTHDDIRAAQNEAYNDYQKCYHD